MTTKHTPGLWRYGWDTTRRGVTGPRASPGIWLPKEIRQVPIHVAGGDADWSVAWLLTADKEDDLEADARLIAAAPALLEALQLARSCIAADRDGLHDCHANPTTRVVDDELGTAGIADYDATLATIDAAIAAATGEEE